MTRMVSFAMMATVLASLAARAEEGKLNDPQIATVALTAHQIDIARGKLALKHTHNAEVKQFAVQMVHDHEAGVKEAMSLAGQLKIKPEQSPVSKSLSSDAAKVKKRLEREKGKAFDRDYMDTEVAYHEAVIDAVKKVLVPGARNDQLKTLLETAIPTLEGHLAHAKMVQSQLSAGK